MCGLVDRGIEKEKAEEGGSEFFGVFVPFLS